MIPLLFPQGKVVWNNLLPLLVSFLGPLLL